MMSSGEGIYFPSPIVGDNRPGSDAVNGVFFQRILSHSHGAACE